MKTIEVPEWLRRRYADIVTAAVGKNSIGGWAHAYSHGYIQADEMDFPPQCPTEVPLYDGDGGDWADYPHKDLHAEIRTIYDTGFPGLTTEERAERQRMIAAGEIELHDRDYEEFHFGTYAVFRVTDDELARMNEGYDEPSNNERVLKDDDGHTIVVYML